MAADLARVFTALLLLGLGAAPAAAGGPAGQPLLTMVAAGADHFAALDKEGGLWVWGGNDAGQLGLGDDRQIAALANNVPIARTRPERLGGDFVYVAAGNQCTLAIKRDGSLWGWGRGVPGLEIRKTYFRPALVTRMPVKEVHPGDSFAMVRDADDALWRFGNPGDDKTPEPAMPSYFTDGVRQVSVSGEHAVVMLNDGTAWTYGTSKDAALLGRKAGSYPDLVQVGIDEYASATTEQAFTLLQRADGSTELFGDMRYLRPMLAADKATFASPVRGIYHYRDQYAGTLLIYLLGNDGDLSLVTVEHSDGKALPSAARSVGSGFVSVRSSYNLLIGLRRDASVWVWGESSAGIPGLADGAAIVAEPQRVIFPDVKPGAFK